MFSVCEACKRDGHCAKHPLETCSRCGLRYVDDSDWSGPAHGVDDCFSRLTDTIATLRRDHAAMREALEEIAGAVPLRPVILSMHGQGECPCAQCKAIRALAAVGKGESRGSE